jgi:hypothetical protein
MHGSAPSSWLSLERPKEKDHDFRELVQALMEADLPNLEKLCLGDLSLDFEALLLFMKRHDKLREVSTEFCGFSNSWGYTCVDFIDEEGEDRAFVDDIAEIVLEETGTAMTDTCDYRILS